MDLVGYGLNGVLLLGLLWFGLRLASGTLSEEIIFAALPFFGTPYEIIKIPRLLVKSQTPSQNTLLGFIFITSAI
jgi:hypothetical protein